MSLMFVLSITLAAVTAFVWLQEQNAPSEQDQHPPFVFAFGMLVRLLLMVVIMIAVSMGMSTFLVS